MGRVNILQWAGSKGFDFENSAVANEAAHCLAASEDGHINAQLEWTGLDFPSASLLDSARHAAFGGQDAVLEWLKDSSMHVARYWTRSLHSCCS
jgi:hypothetical protein